MLSKMMQFEKDFEAEMLNHSRLSSKVRELHYWLAFFMTFCHNWHRSWKYVFCAGNYVDALYLPDFLEYAKEYNALFDPSNPQATVEAHLDRFYRDNAAFTQSDIFERFITFLSEKSFKKDLSEAFPVPQQQC